MADRAAPTQDLWQVNVTPRSQDLDAHGRDLLGDIHRLGLTHVRAVGSGTVYFLAGVLDAVLVDRIASELLTDPVIQQYTCSPGTTQRDAARASVEVHYQPGVMDPVALSTRGAIRELLEALGASEQVRIDQVRTARRYTIDGVADLSELERIAGQVLANDCIETVYLTGFGRRDPLPATLPEAPVTPFEPRTVPLRALDAAGLAELSRRAHLFLSVQELEAIREHFCTLKRDPTDLELETLAQTWSEHCVHKTLKSEIVYRGPGFGETGTVEIRYDNLLASTIAKVTRDLDRDWCLSVFEDNAGVIAFDDRYGIAFKVETHNHPSAIEPYGGAATGIGGCIRDILGCGLGAKPIASTDVFCFAPPDYPEARLPRGVLHPRRVFKGVVGGVRDYGNRMGIPTVNGAVYFDERYLANPLVFCGSVGLIPRDRIAKSPQVGDRIVLVGGRTGRDGIHGATFSSAELTDTHADEFSHAVQIGNAIEEKKVLDALLRARDHQSGCLFNAVTDCGAGGLSSAVGEMGRRLGAAVDLEKVPLKYAGLRYDEIWISEAQERMVLAVARDKLAAVLRIFAEEEVEAAVIGEFTGDGQLRVRYDGTVVGLLDMEFLHDGLPKSQRVAEWSPPPGRAGPARRGDPADRLLDELASFNVASKEWVIRQYDHEVQGGSAIKPLCGPGDGPSDAAVLRPRLDGYRGIALGCGLAPHLSDTDPYRMAIAAVDEALRNVVCVGGDPQRTAILDNFCWGGVSEGQSLGELVRACQGAHDAALAYGLPFISGKDSLNNEFSQDRAEARRLDLPERISIPGTLLISAVSIIEDVRRCVTADLKKPGDRLILVRPPAEAKGLEDGRNIHARVATAIRNGRVRAAHDLSDGGLAAALAEMCIAAELGAEISLDGLVTRALGDADRGMRDEGEVGSLLFDPALTSYCLEVAPDDDWAEAIPLGTVTDTPRLVVTCGGTALIDLKVATLGQAWQAPLRDGPGGTGGGVAAGLRAGRRTAPQPTRRSAATVGVAPRPTRRSAATVGVLVVRAAGINCDMETVHAWQQAGAVPRLVHANELIARPSMLAEAQILTIPGGFSYGDDIAAGTILGSRFAHHLGNAVRDFIAAGKLVLGICNGFQVLVKMGLLPGRRLGGSKVSLAPNTSARFEDRWVRLRVCTDRCLFLRRSQFLEAPVAHAEGRLVVDSQETLEALRDGGHVALRYVDGAGGVGDYPVNPNGSVDAIAGLTDDTGQVLGLMPHPERHVERTQHPLWTHRPDQANASGLDVFRSAVESAQ